MLNSSKSRQITYALFALAGVTLTSYFNVQYMLEQGGFSLSDFIQKAYINNASSSLTNDVLVIWGAFIVWSYIEARRLSMARWWVYILLTATVAVAFAVPVFLLMRERRLAQMTVE